MNDDISSSSSNNNNNEFEFYKHLKEIEGTNNANNRKNFDQAKISYYIGICQKKIAKNPKEYYILRKFDTWFNSDDGTSFLICKNNNNNKSTLLSSSSSPPPIFTTLDKFYGFIKTAHERTFHAGIKKTYEQVRKMVENIKIEHVRIYISLCFFCKNIKNKKRNKSKFCVRKPIVSNGFNERGQVDLIDIRCLKMGEWRYILHYQDNLTKFCSLRPLTDKKNDLVVSALMEIFNIFGAPKILQSDNGKEFRGKAFVNYFAQFWPDVKLIKSSPYCPNSQGSVERANAQVKDMILACIHHQDLCLSLGYDLKNILSHVQYVKNNSFNRTIKCTPYKAMFGQDVVVEQKVEHVFSIRETTENETPQDQINDVVNNNLMTELKYRNDCIENCRENAITGIKQNAEKMLLSNSLVKSNEFDEYNVKILCQH